MSNDKNNNKSGLWTYQQTAEYLGSTTEDPISERSIMRLCQEGKIRRVYPISKKPRIVPESVEEYVASLIAKLYDSRAQDGGDMIGARKWQKSIPAQTPRIGGRDTKTRMESTLDALLRSPKKQDTKP